MKLRSYISAAARLPHRWNLAFISSEGFRSMIHNITSLPFPRQGNTQLERRFAQKALAEMEHPFMMK